MVSNPALILYTCIASGTAILAEFNTRDTDMATLAIKCLENTPNHHIYFTHTIQNRSHTFLIHSPFVYFAIYDKKLEFPDVLTFLKSVKNAFDVIHLNNADAFQSHDLSSHCFQGEFNPVFHQLLASSAEFETSREGLEIPRNGNTERGDKRFGSMPLLGESVSPRSLKKKKKRFGGFHGDNRDGLFENKVDVCDRNFPRNGLYETSSSTGGNYKAKKKVWRRHVWVVLTLDLVLCLVLFAVWLMICKGFKCIDN